MRQMFHVLVGSLLVCLSLSICLSAQKAQPGLLGAEELKRLIPSSYFFDGQSAPVEVRNSAAFRTASGKMVLAGLVDTSGYAADIQQKYQGFFITEIKLSVGGSDLGPGAYGFGFAKDGKFLVMDVAAMDLLSVASSTDDKVAHPVPLKMMEDSGGGYRLYHGKSFVILKAQ
ncbi:MAG TPA: hypothetical protein VJQ82_22855 [Terriglobales bacterium]|nr:hypothetical protein [Terriglobales bacterium]